MNLDFEFSILSRNSNPSSTFSNDSSSQTMKPFSFQKLYMTFIRGGERIIAFLFKSFKEYGDYGNLQSIDL